MIGECKFCGRTTWLIDSNIYGTVCNPCYDHLRKFDKRQAIRKLRKLKLKEIWKNESNKINI